MWLGILLRIVIAIAMENARTKANSNIKISATSTSNFYHQPAPSTLHPKLADAKALILDETLPHRAKSSMTDYDCTNQPSTRKSKNSNTIKSQEQLKSSKCQVIHNSDTHHCPTGTLEWDANTCFEIYENQQFPPFCRYPNVLSYHKIRETIGLYYDKTIWLHAIRNTTSGFPDFEWVERGSHYGSNVIEDINNQHETDDKNCLVTYMDKFFRVSCSAKHSTMCFYSRKVLYQNLNILDYKLCMVAHFDYRCYYIKSDETRPKKKNFCKKLAEPIQKLQMNVVLELIKYGYGYNQNADICWIGLHKDASGAYKWSSTNESVNYTQWVYSDACKYSEGAAYYSTYPAYSGWKLVEDRTLSCAVCEVVPQFKTPTIKIFYVAAEKKIKIFVSSQYINFRNVYCFSDYFTNDFKHRIPINTSMNIMELSTIGEDRPSYYWCEAFHIAFTNVVKSNIIIAFKTVKGYGNEFSVTISAKVAPQIDPFIKKTHLEVCEYIKKLVSTKLDIILYVRPMRAHFNEIENIVHLLIHITTKTTTDSTMEEYKKLEEVLADGSNHSTINITGLFSSEFCLPTSSETDDGLILQWPETRIGATVIPTNVLCLDETYDMIPVTRKCKGDFLYGTNWAKPIGTCHKNASYSSTSAELFELLNSNATAENITEDLRRIIQQGSVTQLIDVHLISLILQSLSIIPGEELDTMSYLMIISDAMNLNSGTLREAQLLLNSTDRILSALDYFLSDKKPAKIILPNLIVQISELRDLKGVALYKKIPEPTTMLQYEVKQLFNNLSLDTLLGNAQLETVILLPDGLSEKIEANLNKSLQLVTAIYNNDFFFNQKVGNVQNKVDKTKIIGVSIPGFPEDQPPFNIKIWFRMPKRYINVKSCSHWKYGLNSVMVSAHGRWKGDSTSRKAPQMFEICEFPHMTHFGVFLRGPPVEEVHERPLEILTILGLLLSLIGIVPIFVTGLSFKRWRSRSGNVILIQFCIAITAQTAFTLALQAIEVDGVACKIVGVGLHYTILAEFCWMYIIALLQYKRFVVVMNAHEKNVLMKSLLIGWCAPLLPVLITICQSPNNYAVNEYNFCYVAGRYFTYGLVLPIVVILSSNAIIFTIIIYNISRPKPALCLGKNRSYKLEILLAVLLFSILGMTWIFGIIGAAGGGVAFTYIFCIASTLRGLVLFLFFILGNEETRQLWQKCLEYFPNSKMQKLK